MNALWKASDVAAACGGTLSGGMKTRRRRATVKIHAAGNSGSRAEGLIADIYGAGVKEENIS
ncbi:PTS glucitol/sorbitol transporter subunit IIB, partial [Citrobacter braakii]|nr:PTS glucitol/sorbitol transporter subunit IIB [Citrobacter braakii]